MSKKNYLRLQYLEIQRKYFSYVRVGKTSLLNSYVDQKFLQSYKATVGADFMQKQVVVDGKIINLEIWDTAGQQKFRILGGAFYRGADCCVLVYDITNNKSFNNIESWITQFINQGAPKEPEKFPFILIGNKIDRQSEREVQQEIVNSFLQKHPKINHLTTSAKNREAVQVAFQQIALASILNKQQQIYKLNEIDSYLLKYLLANQQAKSRKKRIIAGDQSSNLLQLNIIQQKLFNTNQSY